MISPRSFLRVDPTNLPALYWETPLWLFIGLVDFTSKSKVAYSGLKTTMALSTPWEGRKRHNATLPL